MAKYYLCKESKEEFDFEIGRNGEVLERAVENTRLIHETSDREYALT